MSTVNLRETIAVLIVAKDEEERIQSCIRQFTPHVDEVILLDDHSSDDTYKRVLGLPAKQTVYPPRLDEPHQSKLYNYGMTLTNAEWVLISDADEIWPREFLQNIRQIMRDVQTKYGLVLGYRLPRDNLLRDETTWPDFQIRLVFRQSVEYRGEEHPIAWSKEHDAAVDKVSCFTLGEDDKKFQYVIKHLPRNPKVRRTWW